MRNLLRNLLVVQNANYCVFFEKGSNDEAKQLRKIDTRLKHAHLQNIFTTHPCGIESGKIYKRGEITQIFRDIGNV